VLLDVEKDQSDEEEGGEEDEEDVAKCQSEPPTTGLS